MIVEKAGNLLLDDAQALVNTVNTVGVMGKGLALEFKRAFPANFDTYAQACRDGRVQPGRIFVTPFHGHRWILNFPTKRHWREPSRLEDIRSGLDALVCVIVELNLTGVALPALGCGNGGLDWETARPLIIEKLGSGRSTSFDLHELPEDATPAVGCGTVLTAKIDADKPFEVSFDPAASIRRCCWSSDVPESHAPPPNASDRTVRVPW